MGHYFSAVCLPHHLEIFIRTPPGTHPSPHDASKTLDELHSRNHKTGKSSRKRLGEPHLTHTVTSSFCSAGLQTKRLGQFPDKCSSLHSIASWSRDRRTNETARPECKHGRCNPCHDVPPGRSYPRFPANIAHPAQCPDFILGRKWQETSPNMTRATTSSKPKTFYSAIPKIRNAHSLTRSPLDGSCRPTLLPLSHERPTPCHRM